MGGIMSPEYHAEYSKKYLANPENRRRRAELARLRYSDPQNAEKVSARLAVRRAVKSGALVKANCQDCGSEETEAHHPDYSRPLYVEWLCRKHHRDRHPRPRKDTSRPLVLRTICRHGHPYDSANTYVRNGTRHCRKCNAASAARYKAKAVQS